jgi:hypothetical protein
VAAVTEQEVMTLPAGKELDAAVGITYDFSKEFVCPECSGDEFGVDVRDGFISCHCCPWQGTWDNVAWQDFSGNYSWAMTALFAAQGIPPVHFTLSPRRDGQGYLCHLEIDNGYVGFGKELPEAICRCCLLLAVAKQKEKPASCPN